jgi:hypothetical protein
MPLVLPKMSEAAAARPPQLPRADLQVHARCCSCPRLPVLQEKSYFALRLPAGWWVFGLDLALVGDIDMCQYRCGVDAMA